MNNDTPVYLLGGALIGIVIALLDPIASSAATTPNALSLGVMVVAYLCVVGLFEFKKRKKQ